MMAEGLQFAHLATLVGKRRGAWWGNRRVTIGAVGWKDGERFVMGTLADGSVVLGAPSDFQLSKASSVSDHSALLPLF